MLTKFPQTSGVSVHFAVTSAPFARVYRRLNAATAFRWIAALHSSANPDCLRLRTARTDHDVYPNYTASRWSVSPSLRQLGATVFVPAGNPVRLAMAGAASDRSSRQNDIGEWPVGAGTTSPALLREHPSSRERSASR